MSKRAKSQCRNPWRDRDGQHVPAAIKRELRRAKRYEPDWEPSEDEKQALQSAGGDDE